MKILLGTHYLAKTGGTESYTYALAMELKQLGHDVEHFAIVRGGVSSMLEEQGVPFMSSSNYDLILANHYKVVEKLWPYGFIIQTCHGNIAELEQPSYNADAYVAVSEEVKDHLLSKGIKNVKIIHNGIDCNRFFPIKPVSKKLTTVLSLCQSEVANDFIRKCCEQVGVTFLRSNKFIDNVWSVEELINRSDLVVGLGRSAYDAMACGRAVLVYDYREYMGEFLGDGMLTPETIEKSLLCNCSGRASRLQFDEQAFIKEMQKFTPELGSWGREYALEHFNIKWAAQQYLDIYERTDFKQEYLALKSRMKNKQKVDTSTLEGMIAELEHKKEVLQMTFTEKNQKHLRAIRMLFWLVIALFVVFAAYIYFSSRL